MIELPLSLILARLLPKTDIHLQVFEDRVRARNLRSGQVAEERPSTPYTHPRTLVGDFTIAQSTVKKAMDAVRGGGFRSIRVLMQPMSKYEGGLTQVEDRLFMELGLGAGAMQAVVWVGEPLSDHAIQEKLGA